MILFSTSGGVGREISESAAKNPTETRMTRSDLKIKRVHNSTSAPLSFAERVDAGQRTPGPASIIRVAYNYRLPSRPFPLEPELSLIAKHVRV
jgi:hypothetical protein